MNRLNIYKIMQHLIVLLLIIISAISCSIPISSNHKPNIIIFLTDDQGYGDLGCYGTTNYNTPNIDKLASNGIRFTDFYVLASVCTPSRAALLTGKYPKRVGLHRRVLFPYSENGLSQAEFTLAELLKGAGYKTGIIGKWHLGHLPQYLPTRNGFDYFYGVPYSNDMDGHKYKNPPFQSPPLPVFLNDSLLQKGPNQDSLTWMWTTAAVEFIQKNQKNPFFLYLAHNMPHLPWHASDNFRGSSNYSLYGDAIKEIDWSMGEIIRTLKETGIVDNTIIIFTSDNGPVTRKKNGGSAGSLRGSKATTWEGGFRVPGIISWPAAIPQNKLCTVPVSTLDLFPTLSVITGALYPPNIKLDGRDITSLLFNPDKEFTQEFRLLYYSREGNLEAYRKDNWKLHIAKESGWQEDKGEFPISLFNLKDDVSEKINRIDQNPALYEEMKKEMKNLDNLILSNQ